MEWLELLKIFSLGRIPLLRNTKKYATQNISICSVVVCIKPNTTNDRFGRDFESGDEKMVSIFWNISPSHPDKMKKSHETNLGALRSI